MMRWLFFLSIFFGIALLAFVIIGGGLMVIVRILRGGVSRKEQYLLAEEAKMIQSLYSGLSRMESRVEALEKILLEKGDKGDHRS